MKLQLAFIGVFILLAANPPAAQAEVDWPSIERNCLQRQWAQESCSFLNEPPGDHPDDYFREGSDQILDPVLKLGFILSNQSHRVRKTWRAWAQWAEGNSDQPLAYDTEGEILLRDLRRNLRGLIRQNRPSQCIAACMALCLSANAIQYQLGQGTMSVPDILENGAGKCTDFTNLALDLLTSIGISAEVAQSRVGRHSFIRLRVQKHSYFAEPQSDICEFWR